MIWKLIAFLALAGALFFALPFVPPVRAGLASVACEPDETYEWKQTSYGTDVSYGWVCVDRDGRFSVSETSVRSGELAAAGLAFAGACVLAAIPFGIARLLRARRPR